MVHLTTVRHPSITPLQLLAPGAVMNLLSLESLFLGFSHPPPPLPCQHIPGALHATPPQSTLRYVLRSVALRHASKAPFKAPFFHRHLAAKQNSEGWAGIMQQWDTAEPAPRIVDGREDDQHAPKILQRTINDRERYVKPVPTRNED